MKKNIRKSVNQKSNKLPKKQVSKIKTRAFIKFALKLSDENGGFSGGSCA